MSKQERIDKINKLLDEGKIKLISGRELFDIGFPAAIAQRNIDAWNNITSKTQKYSEADLLEMGFPTTKVEDTVLDGYKMIAIEDLEDT